MDLHSAAFIHSPKWEYTLIDTAKRANIFFRRIVFWLQVPTTVKTILQDKCTNLHKNSSQFWLLCAALKEFLLEYDDLLPVQGSLPDMTSDSERYIRLQNIYRNRASKDAQRLFDIACQLRKQHNVDVEVTLKDAQLFCKNAAFLRVINGSSYVGEVKEARETNEEISPGEYTVARYAIEAMDEDQPIFNWYVFLFNFVDILHILIFVA